MWITGVVDDDRGRALPGATIEASGPAVISRRSVLSDSRGQYVMQDLHPGVYTITSTHPHCATLHRETTELSPLVATINARLVLDSCRQ
jgi:protocatechuate 3,4-dioxygenase beta subunit